MKTVCLLGSSSGRNAGDAALIGAIMRDLDQTLRVPLRYEVPTTNPAYVKRYYAEHDVTPVSIMPWNASVRMLGPPTYRSIRRADIVLIFDAILFDRSLLNPLFNFMSPLYLMLPRARARGVKMGMYDVGVGPVSSALGKRMLRKLVSLMDFITVRDEGSIDVLKAAGAYRDSVILAADAAVNSPYTGDDQTTSLLNDRGIDTSREFIAINVNPYLDSWAAATKGALDKATFLKEYSGALSSLWEKIRVPYLFVCTQHMDVDITRDLQDSLDPVMCLGRFSNRDCGHQEIKAVLGRAGLTVGMRLHSIILSAAMRVPVVGLVYQPKVEFFLRFIGLDRYALYFNDFSAANLESIIHRAWENRAEIRAQLERRVPELEEEARKPAYLVQELLEPEV